MKHTIILLALLAVSVGCKPESHPTGKEIENGFIQTVSYEGCEYLSCKTTRGFYVLSHKGNCPNPIHYSDTCCKQERRNTK